MAGEALAAQDDGLGVRATRAAGGTRTPTGLAAQQILSLERLPFRHGGRVCVPGRGSGAEQSHFPGMGRVRDDRIGSFLRMEDL